VTKTGYVLAGGRSLRMGRDKALLPWRGAPLVLHVAAVLAQAAGPVKLVGDPDRHASLGLPVIPDLHPGCGPLGGIEAALDDSSSDWNLIVACDMPELTVAHLESLFQAAEASDASLVMAAGPDGRPEPLCAAWRRHLRREVAAAVATGVRRVTDVLPLVPHILVPASAAIHFRNLNTPEDWSAHAAR
jgi:molybdenum cofactor guanylyltransferase